MLDTERLCLGCMNDNGGEKVCSICGHDAKLQNDPDFLPVKAWIKNRYYVGKAFENNGEGVTYIGWDNEEDSIVNIREYFPKGAAFRAANKSVGIVKGNEFTFNEGIMNFLDLNRKLKELQNLPALPQIAEVFEANGTAYCITKAVPGITLREFLIRNGGNLSWEQARPLFLPVITTLSALHEAGILHRGISPETIIVGRDGKLRLASLCIRPVRMAKSNMTIQLFPGYSAIEQYDYDLDMTDGAYTDVYGIAATIFRVIMGKAPTDVTERISNDNMQVPARYAEKLPKYVLTALANALQIMPEKRTQNMDAFRISLTPVSNETATVKIAPHPADTNTAAPAPAKPQKRTEKQKDGSGKAVVISAVVTALIFLVIAAAVYFIFLKPANNSGGENTSSVQSGESTPEPENKPIIIDPEDKDKLYQIPDLVGKKYADILDNSEYALVFEFINEATAYSDEFDRGVVMDQEPKSDQTVKKGAQIKVTISAGASKVSLPDLAGKTKDEATLELLKRGFIYENIKVLNVYDASVPTGVVVATEPEAKSKISRSAGVVLRINAYEHAGGEIPDTSSEE